MRQIMQITSVLLLTACQASPHETRQVSQEEGENTGAVIAVENRTRQVIRKITVLDAYPNRKQEYPVVHKRALYLQPGAAVPIFLPGVRLCVFRIHFEYTDGSLGVVGPQDVCHNSMMILLKEDSPKAEKTPKPRFVGLAYSDR